MGVPLEDPPRPIEIGKSEVLKEGNDLVILAIGSTVYPALSAARQLGSEGIRAAVVNGRFVKPLDAELLYSIAARVKRVITVEENVLMGGFGSAVLEMFQEKGLRDIAVKRLGIPDVFVEHATQSELRRKYGIDEEGIKEAARQMNSR